MKAVPIMGSYRTVKNKRTLKRSVKHHEEYSAINVKLVARLSLRPKEPSSTANMPGNMRY